MKKGFKVLAVMLAMACVLIGFTGCGSSEDKAAEDNGKTLKIGTNAELEPFEYVDS